MTNKEKAKLYHQAVSEYDIGTIENLVHENYIQHNPNVPTGRAAFVSLIPKLKEHKTKIENKRIMQDGDYVFMHHKWINAIPFGAQTMVAFHVIRFNEEGLIAEHWNVISKIELSNIEGETKIIDLDKTMENKLIVINLIESLILDTKDSKIKFQKLHKVLGEGNFVLSIAEGSSNGQAFALYDLFRLHNGKIVEKWNVYQPIPTKNIANNNTMFNFR